MSKIALTKRVSITMRGFSILKQYCPGLAQGKAAYELINSYAAFPCASPGQYCFKIENPRMVIETLLVSAILLILPPPFYRDYFCNILLVSQKAYDTFRSA